jgi:hypothetical protein
MGVGVSTKALAIFIIIILTSSSFQANFLNLQKSSDNIPHAFAQTAPSGINQIGNYVIFGLNGVHLESGNTVTSGDVGAQNPSFQVTLESNSNISPGPNSALVGDSLTIHTGSVVNDVYYNKLSNSGTIQGTKNTPLTLPVVTDLPVFPTFTPGSQSITVNAGSSLILQPGNYGSITVGNQATLEFAGGTYNVNSIQAGTNSNLFFDQASQVLVKNQFNSGNGLRVEPSATSSIDASGIIFYVGSGVGPGSSSIISANIYAPNGQIHLQANTIATGSFIGGTVHIEKNSITTLDSAFGAQITWNPSSLNVQDKPSLPLQLNFTSNEALQNVAVEISSNIQGIVTAQNLITSISSGVQQQLPITLFIPPSATSGWYNGTITLAVNGNQLSSSFNLNIFVPKVTTSTVQTANGNFTYVATPSYSPFFNNTSDLSIYFTFTNGTTILLQTYYDLFPASGPIPISLQTKSVPQNLISAYSSSLEAITKALTTNIYNIPAASAITDPPALTINLIGSLPTSYIKGLAFVPYSAETHLYAVDSSDTLIQEINPADATRIGSPVTMSLTGKTFTWSNGLATNPITNVLYGAVTISGQTGRELVTIDPLTGTVTDIGNTGYDIAGLAFGSDGTLYGITGSGSSTPNTIFTINTSTAQATLFLAVSGGTARSGSGQAIAFNPDDGYLYHAWGNDPTGLEKINLATKTITSINIGSTVIANGGQVFAMTYWNSNHIFLLDEQNSLYSIKLPPPSITTTTVTPNPSTALTSSVNTFTAKVTDTSGSPTTPTGTVSWSDGGAGGSFISPTCTLAGVGSSASCNVFYNTSSNAGSVTINATYGGDSSHFGSSGTSSLTVNQGLPASQCTQYGITYNDFRDLNTTSNDISVADNALSVSSGHPLIIRDGIHWNDTDHGYFLPNGTWIGNYTNDALIDNFFNKLPAGVQAYVILDVEKPPQAIADQGNYTVPGIGSQVYAQYNYKAAANAWITHVINRVKADGMLDRVAYWQIDNEPNIHPAVGILGVVGLLTGYADWKTTADSLQFWLGTVKSLDPGKPTVINVIQTATPLQLLLYPFNDLLSNQTVGQELSNNMSIMGFDIYPDQWAIPTISLGTAFNSALGYANSEITSAQNNFGFAGRWGIIEMAAGPKVPILLLPQPLPSVFATQNVTATDVANMINSARTIQLGGQYAALISLFQLRALDSGFGATKLPFNDAYGLISTTANKTNPDFLNAIKSSVVQNCPPPTGQLTVVKKIVNTGGGTLTISNVTLQINGTTFTNGTANTLPVGNYTVSENPIPRYTSTISGDCASDGTITLNANDAKNCIITNTFTPFVFFENFDDGPLTSNGWSSVPCLTGYACIGQSTTSQEGYPAISPPYWGFVRNVVSFANCLPGTAATSKSFTVTQAGNYNVSAWTAPSICEGCIIHNQLLVDGNLLFDHGVGFPFSGPPPVFDQTVIPLSAGTHSVTMQMHATDECNGFFPTYMDNIGIAQTNSAPTPPPIGGPYFTLQVNQTSFNATSPSTIVVPLKVIWNPGWSAEHVNGTFMGNTTSIVPSITSVVNTTSSQMFNMTLNVQPNVQAGNYSAAIQITEPDGDSQVSSIFVRVQ